METIPSFPSEGLAVAAVAVVKGLPIAEEEKKQERLPVLQQRRCSRAVVPRQTTTAAVEQRRTQKKGVSTRGASKKDRWDRTLSPSHRRSERD